MEGQPAGSSPRVVFPVIQTKKSKVEPVLELRRELT